MQDAFHASGSAPADPVDTGVGPFRLRVVEPMRRLVITVADNDTGITADLEWRARVGALEEDHTVRHDGVGRVMVDMARFLQFGTWAGQVTVDAKAIAEGLQSEGKVTLSGLFFDTGKSELKPESAAQLEAMSQLLQSQAQVRVFIVGHTDNIGSLEANQALSQARAQAVVAALTAAPYRVDAKRLMARGVGPLAPQATNADEAGRARNRRVEMVLQ